MVAYYLVVWNDKHGWMFPVGAYGDDFYPEDYERIDRVMNEFSELMDVASDALDKKITEWSGRDVAAVLGLIDRFDEFTAEQLIMYGFVKMILGIVGEDVNWFIYDEGDVEDKIKSLERDGVNFG